MAVCEELRLRVARAFSPGMHGTTFGGGPLACAVAIAVIDTMKQNNLLAHIREVGRRRLQTTAIGLAIHIVEHGQRHTGQAITTCRLKKS